MDADDISQCFYKMFKVRVPFFGIGIVIDIFT